MELETISTRTQSLLTLFDMQTIFFKRAIEGVADEDAHSRLETKANHMAWIAGAIVHQRFQMIQETAPEVKSKVDYLFKDYQGIKDGVIYPSLKQFADEWNRVTPYARQALTDISDDKLDSDLDMGGTKMSYYEVIAFTLYREASFIGQLALWRRLLGYPAMTYD